MNYHIYGAGHDYRFESELTVYYAKKHIGYNDYEYSMKELNAELERLGIPYKTGGGTGNAYYDLTYRDRMNKKNEAASSIVESRKAAEMLAAMKELL